MAYSESIPLRYIETLWPWSTNGSRPSITKRSGFMYIVFALLFLVVMGIEAIPMRIQLAHANSTFLSPQEFNRLFTMHGTTGLFRGDADSFRLRQLSRAADDRRARHGLPAAECFQLLDDGLGGFLLYCSFLAGAGFRLGARARCRAGLRTRR